MERLACSAARAVDRVGTPPQKTPSVQWRAGRSQNVLVLQVRRSRLSRERRVDLRPGADGPNGLPLTERSRSLPAPGPSLLCGTGNAAESRGVARRTTRTYNAACAGP